MSIKSRSKELLQEGVAGVLGCRAVDGSYIPYLFGVEDVEEMPEEHPEEERYPVASILRRLLAEEPGSRLAAVVRGCDERAIVELAKQGQLDLDRVVMLGVACSEEKALSCGCFRPYPTEFEEGSKVEPGEDRRLLEAIEGLPADERLAFWLSRFGSCIKCYGCRNICPMCYCNRCSLEEPGLVVPGEVPPDQPAFHLIRALDMAARCVDCGLCEEACPMDIPIRSLYRKVGDVVEEKFGYRPGVDLSQESPLAVLGTEKDLE